MINNLKEKAKKLIELRKHAPHLEEANVAAEIAEAYLKTREALCKISRMWQSKDPRGDAQDMVDIASEVLDD